MDQTLKDAKQQAGQATDQAETKWAQMKADASAKLANVQVKVQRRNDQLDARVAGSDADWATSDAYSAIDFADWAVENARLAILDAIDARVYADQRAAAVKA
jgi:hypothetical protein